jgi:D-glycero-alpha-D-manno-heptose 1-phosphate guanylyltransferase
MKEAVILAGGKGTRLQSVVSDVPKPMAPIRGVPFLHGLIESLVRKGFTHIILALGYQADLISDYFGDVFLGVPISYVVESEPLGTGGALRLAMTACRSDHVYALNGDTYLAIDFDRVDALWRAHKQPILVGCAVDDVSRFGALVTEDDYVVSFSEKDKKGPGVINSGCYVLSANQLDFMPLHQPFSFEKDYLIQAVSRRVFRAFVATGFFIDIGVPSDYQRAQAICFLEV